jgi:hypothetical protein
MPKAIDSTTTSRRGLLGIAAIMPVAAVAAALPRAVPHEAAASQDLAALCERAVALRGAENRLHERRISIADEEATDGELAEVQDAQAAALYEAAGLPLRTVTDLKLAARTIVTFAYTDGAGRLDPETFLGEVGTLASRLIETLAA